MSDPLLSIWPVTNSRRVVKAEAQVVEASQGLYRIVFADSAGKQLAIQVPLPVLKMIADTAQTLIDDVS